MEKILFINKLFCTTAVFVFILTRRTDINSKYSKKDCVRSYSKDYLMSHIFIPATVVVVLAPWQAMQQIKSISHFRL
jgi:hypothetical protein